jgi:hypothetical protein
MSPFKVPKVKKPEIPKTPTLDPAILEKIKELIDTISGQLIEEGEVNLGEIVEDEIKGKIHEKVMAQIEPQLDSDILKKLADKSVEKGIEKAWDKIKQKIAEKAEEE